jgi:imidazolonepropionase-like amidohydrolase
LRDSLATDRPHVLAAGPRLAAAPSDLDLPGEKYLLSISNAREAEEAVGYLASHGADAVVLAPRVTGRRERMTSQALSAAIAAARGRGMRIVAQVNSLADAKAALRAGVDVLGSEIDAPIDEEFLTLARSTGTVYTATFTPAKQSQQAAGIRAANLKRVHAAGIPIAVGSAAGEHGVAHGVSIHAELEAMQVAGLATPEVLNAATAGGALALGQTAECGSIERGKRADLLLLDADPSVDIRNLRALRAVVRRGELRAASELSDARSR